MMRCLELENLDIRRLAEIASFEGCADPATAASNAAQRYEHPMMAIQQLLPALGQNSPPFGLNLFVASSLQGVSYEQAVKGALPFIGLAIIGLMIVTYVPAISMWLPRMLYAGL